MLQLNIISGRTECNLLHYYRIPQLRTYPHIFQVGNINLYRTYVFVWLQFCDYRSILLQTGKVVTVIPVTKTVQVWSTYGTHEVYHLSVQLHLIRVFNKNNKKHLKNFYMITFKSSSIYSIHHYVYISLKPLKACNILVCFLFNTVTAGCVQYHVCKQYIIHELDTTTTPFLIILEVVRFQTSKKNARNAIRYTWKNLNNTTLPLTPWEASTLSMVCRRTQMLSPFLVNRVMISYNKNQNKK